MEQSSRQQEEPYSASYVVDAAERHPKIVICFTLWPGQTRAWRIAADARLRVHGARVWLTRLSDPYDYWMAPGEAIHLRRGERIHLSSDGAEVAKVSLISDHLEAKGLLRRWRLRAPILGFLTPRS